MDKAKELVRNKLELSKQQERMAEEVSKVSISRIQFRLTDGSSVVNKFEPEQTLEDARTFITQVDFYLFET